MKKVFYRCIESYSEAWTEGKEYECINGKIVTDFGDLFSSAAADKMCWKWQFADVVFYNSAVADNWPACFERIEREFFEVGGFTWFRDTPGDPMPCAAEAVMTLSWGDGIADDTAAIKAIQGRQPFGERKNAAMIERDVSAVGDSSLSPAQRRHWDKMEAKQAAKEQLQRDAEAKSLQERAKQLSDAGNAMDRVNQDHGHKLGAMQCTLHGK